MQRHQLLYEKEELESFSLYERRRERAMENTRLPDTRKLRSGKNQSGK